jgi:hypothetical protein
LPGFKSIFRPAQLLPFHLDYLFEKNSGRNLVRLRAS